MYLPILSEGMDKLINAMEIVGDMAVIVSPEHRVLFENSSCKKVHGDNVGRICYEVYPRRNEPCENCPAQSVFKYNKTAKSENFVTDVDGNELFIEIVATPIADADNDGKTFAALEIVRDLTERKRAETDKEELILKLQDALQELKTLRGILPICMHCKGIRDEDGDWHKLERYISKHADVQFSHGLCEKCYKEHYPDFF